jgi:uncharacterized membrane protein
MKRLIFLFSLIFLLIPCLTSAESIDNFSANISLLPDKINITETISYDFDNEQRHGIYRDIPIKYDAGYGNRNIEIKVLKVLRDGQNEPFTTSKQGSILQIKIGNADLTITGKHTYEITYAVSGAINFFTDFDEFYWNITGNGWLVPITEASAKIVLPNEVNIKQQACYQGEVGSQTPCVISQVDNTITFQSTETLTAGQGLTLAIGLAKGFWQQPTFLQKLIKIILDNGILLLPIFVFFFMFAYWRRHGRDPKGKGTIIPEYEPPKNMNPTLVGSLIDEKIDNSDITAGLIYLAQQGYLKITRLEKDGFFGKTDYELLVLKNLPDTTQGTNGQIANIIFSGKNIPGSAIKLSELKKDKGIAKRMQQLKKDVSEEMVTLGWYEKNPLTVKIKYITIGGIIMFVGFWFGQAKIVYLISLIISGLIIMTLGSLMPKKTKLGADTKDQILGFKQFLSVTDKERLAWHNAPDKNPQQFMQYLPFAIAMGVEKQWADQFKNMYIENPTWYQGNYGNAIIATQLANDLSGFGTQLNSSMATASHSGAGSSGGGFSGGGFGGGGGGSW